MIEYKLYSNKKFKAFKSKHSNHNIYVTGMIMVKDQEKNIIKAIKSIKKYCDHIIVVDTGSTDSTVSVVETHFPEVELHQVKWIENYAFMRNKCLRYISKGWVLILDADEEFDNSVCSPNEFKTFLAKFDSKSLPVLTVKTQNSTDPAFVRKKTIFKYSPKLTYHGYVHEELTTNNHQSLDLLDTNLKVINKGSSEAELKRFNKPSRYSRLLLKQIHEEPENPRWVAMLSPDYVSMGVLSSEKYKSLLTKFIFKKQDGQITPSNLIKSRYLKYLLARYSLFLAATGEFKKAVACCRTAMDVYPYDTNFLTIFLVVKNLVNKINNQKTLKEVIGHLSKLKDHSSEVKEFSQGTEGSVDPQLVKTLINIGDFKEAKVIANNIGINYRDSIAEEINFLLK